ncbi:LysM peptidoglycan-binding domain-containing protein [Methylobacterium sp. NEAU K]|uniref:LysM peptidoglycan-binding domain-containing protein n=1 Tax=Methylobacterium sp. NEAU K TaxID=3064946 RepID=UPI0027370B3C|nr:LysM peptidoglycan-binding domain-containing protein [Methylobacterium sp. NEAU K]MDP4003837.1 LysM peptidoglycan-binding domain-containing protein [Methylobacterium sp. NEAU K]
MSRRVRRSLALALAGLLGGLGLVLALFGGESLRRMIGRHEAEPPAAVAPNGSLRTLTDPGTTAGPGGPPIDFRDDKPGQASSGETRPGNTKPGDTKSAALPSTDTPPRDAPPAGGGAADGQPPAAPDAAEAPRFDIVRVEPNGDAVVAGRGAPDAVVEMLVDGKPVARATTDANGQFAIVPPALPAGSSEIRLRMTGKDGRASTSSQSVAVNVAPGRDRQPLVALTAPDAATVVLSQPGEPAASGPGPKVAGAPPQGKPADAKAPHGKAQAARIVSVDVQENGRLFVTATGTPGAKLRLYLNDTLIAPGSVGPDGRANFTIGRGVKPGQYQVRIDQIEPGTGRVGARAEVPFSVPEPARIAAREPAGPGPSGTPAPGSGQGAPAAGMPRPEATGPGAADMPSALSRDAAETGAPARAGAVFVPEITTAKITRGDSLWRISQRTYGRGERYTVIYDANQNQIRDPDLIYPGQIFVLPTDKRG